MERKMQKMEKRTVAVEVEVPVTVEDGDLREYLNKEVVLFCVNYIYRGKLIGVNGTNVILSNGGIVYETGDLDGTMDQDFQKFNREFRVRISAIESYFAL